MKQTDNIIDFADMDDDILDITDTVNNDDLSDYLVRLYLKKDKNYWCGSGVIVGSYLITVAHVMMNKDTHEFFPHLFYKNKEYYEITEKDLIYDGRIGLYDDVDNIHHDLLVFKLPTATLSPFNLNKNNFRTPLEVCAKTDKGPIFGYSFEKYEIQGIGGIHHVENQTNEDELIKWRNCLLVADRSNTDKLIEGNSGTPIFKGNVIYGLLISQTWHPDNPCKVLYNFIDARYIRQIIAEVKWINRYR